jgi:hypothetical protein
MKQFTEIAILHLAILLLYTGLMFFTNDGFIIGLFAIPIHFIACLVAAIYNFAIKKYQIGGQYLLIGFLVILIGLGVCAKTTPTFH